MKRRNMLVLLALGVGIRSRPAIAQVKRGSKPFRIGFFPDLSTEEREAFVGALLEFGWSEGTDFITVSTGYQFDPDFDRAAKHMLSQNPDLIVTKATARAR